jgi:hypothetical protein
MIQKSKQKENRTEGNKGTRILPIIFGRLWQNLIEDFNSK